MSKVSDQSLWTVSQNHQEKHTHIKSSFCAFQRLEKTHKLIISVFFLSRGFMKWPLLMASQLSDPLKKGEEPEAAEGSLVQVETLRFRTVVLVDKEIRNKIFQNHFLKWWDISIGSCSIGGFVFLNLNSDGNYEKKSSLECCYRIISWDFHEEVDSIVPRMRKALRATVRTTKTKIKEIKHPVTHPTMMQSPAVDGGETMEEAAPWFTMILLHLEKGQVGAECSSATETSKLCLEQRKQSGVGYL